MKNPKAAEVAAAQNRSESLGVPQSLVEPAERGDGLTLRESTLR